MQIYVVIQETRIPYDPSVGFSIYGVYRDEQAADAAVLECEAQSDRGIYHAVKETQWLE